jgi:Chaperone of endosialidase
MALANLYRVCQDLSGNVVPEVLGTVMLSGTSTLATLFSDQAGTAPLPNPLVNNPTYGSFSVFVGAGIYDMSFIKSGYTFETQYNIALRDPAAGVNVLSGTPNQVILTPPTGVGNVTLSLPQSIAPDSSVQFAHLGLGTPATGDALVVSGASTLAGLAVNGNATVSGTATVNGLAVNGNATVSGTATVNGLAVTGNATVGGTASMLQAEVTQRQGIARTPHPAARLSFTYPNPTEYGLLTQAGAVGASTPLIFLNSAGSVVGSITTTDSATAFNTTSDARLKRHITPLTGALERVRALRPVSFTWNADNSPGVGFLADEVQAIAPEAVTGAPDAVDAAGQILPQGMDLSKLVPYLVGACQTLAQQIEALTARGQAREGTA